MPFTAGAGSAFFARTLRGAGLYISELSDELQGDVPASATAAFLTALVSAGFALAAREAAARAIVCSLGEWIVQRQVGLIQADEVVVLWVSKKSRDMELWLGGWHWLRD